LKFGYSGLVEDELVQVKRGHHPVEINDQLPSQSPAASHWRAEIESAMWGDM